LGIFLQCDRDTAGSRDLVPDLRAETEPHVWGSGDEPVQLLRGDKRTAAELV